MSPSKETRLIGYTHICTRCGHEWITLISAPSRCANRACKSALWNVPYRREGWKKRRRSIN